MCSWMRSRVSTNLVFLLRDVGVLRSHVLVASASMMRTESSSEVSSGGGNNAFTFIHNTDEIRKLITAVKLNGANYLIWFKSTKVALRVKKLKFLLEDSPPKMAVDYENWRSAMHMLCRGCGIVCYVART